MKKLTILLFSILISFSTTSVAIEFSEVWKCKEQSLHGTHRVTLLAKVDESLASGEIKVNGITHNAFYKVKGFSRRWDFGKFNYAFIIRADGRGQYYEFKDSDDLVTPSMTMNCFID